MPWHIAADHSECPASRSWAVVKDADGSVVGCHSTKADARGQLAALNINVVEAKSARPKAPGIEHRVFAVQDIEIRQGKNDDGGHSMHGYAATFNNRSSLMFDWSEGNFVETIEPGAFTKTLAEADVRLLINHDPNLILARTRSKTLTLTEDNVGLHVDADLGPTTYAQDLAVSMKRGDISQMSFAFRTIKDSWGDTEDGLPLRRLHEVALLDTSVVTYPAYPQTTASARSAEFLALIDVLGLTDIDLNDLTNPDRLPTLRAARTALDARIAAAEPHAQHSTFAGYERRHRALATMLGLEGTTSANHD